MTPQEIEDEVIRELGLEAADNGGWEEFHQKRGNYTMYDYHKARRLLLEDKYRKLTKERNERKQTLA